MTFFTIQVL